MTRHYLVLACLIVAGCDPVVRQSTPDFFGPGEYPELLSTWGILAVSGSTLVPHAQSSPYDLNSALFTDYARKYRTIWTPEAGTGEVDGTGRLLLPVGSIITKTFYYAKTGGELVHGSVDGVIPQGLDLDQVRLIETRLLVHTETGWQGLPYIWKEDQTDAVLEITGGVIPLRISNLAEFNYIVPDFNQCKGCHVTDVAAGDMQPIGLAAKHLDKPYRYGASGNQFDLLAAKHALAGQDTATYVTNVDWQDGTVDLNTAARSYLDINCGHCHSRTGPADTSAMFLNAEEADLIHLGVCKPPVAAGQGTGGFLFGINPGQGQRSILTFRMQSDDPGAMMPELGRSLVHREAVALVTDWINAMEGDCG